MQIADMHCDTISEIAKRRRINEDCCLRSNGLHAPKWREVPVRYWVNGDSSELEAIFVKIENDTVYLKKPTEAELRHIERLTDKKAIALQESNGQEVEQAEDENEEVDLNAKSAEIIMTDAVKDSMAAQADTSKAVREFLELMATRPDIRVLFELKEIGRAHV
mgnify:CR=1 FL=1